MRFWAIEVHPGELLVDEVVVSEAVGRVLGVATVEALLLFASRVALDAFMEGFLPDGGAEGGEGSGGRRGLEAAFARELQAMAGAGPTGLEVRLPEFEVGPLLGVLGGLLGEVGYVALDPDTPGQQVWAVEHFMSHLGEASGPA
jgi:hypothetical protein